MLARTCSGTFVIFLIAIAAALLACSSTLAQEYPSKPVRIIVANPGTGTDFTARLGAQALSERWGRPVVVENRGGLPLTGADLVAKAAPDGYTLHMGQVSSHATPMHLHKQLPYDAVRDFSPIALVAKTTGFLVAHPSLPVDNVSDFVDYVRKRPGAIRHAGQLSGGTPSQLAMWLFCSSLKLDILNVPYRGSGGAITAVLGAEAHVAFVNGAAVLPSIAAGKLKALAITSRARFAGTPSVPTINESVIPGFESSSWFGLLAPAKTPSNLIDRLNRDIVAIVRSPRIKAVFVNQAMESTPSTPAEFAAFIQDEITKWGRVINAVGIKPE